MPKEKKQQPRLPLQADGIQVYCAHAAIIPIAELKENPRNPNKHGDRQIALLAKIIKQQGWRNPIVVSARSGLITKGHGRLMAARLLKVSSVPVDVQPYADDAAELADMIADNRIAELAEMDNTLLKDLLQELDTGAFDMELTGFDEEATEELMTSFSEIGKEVLKEKKELLSKRKNITCLLIFRSGNANRSALTSDVLK